MNLPNQITLGRFFLAVIFIGLLSMFDHRKLPGQTWILDVSAALFVIAAVTDILDGYLARKQNQVTSFGRILDPFVDKILIGGAFVLFLDGGFVDAQGRNVTGLSAWMVVLIISRELLVSGLRGFSESGGKPFAANYWGKAKMIVQSITVPTILMSLGRLGDVDIILGFRTFMIWLTLLVTVLSVFAYLVASREALMEQSRG